ncbi:hypothetical protein HYPSUDRAFT_218167, partial [Hypholoma sublateritium FD-334 SS-4]
MIAILVRKGICNSKLEKKLLSGGVIALDRMRWQLPASTGHLAIVSIPHGPRRLVISRVYANEKSAGLFLGLMKFTLDERLPEYVAAQDCSGRAGELRGTSLWSLQDRFRKLGTPTALSPRPVYQMPAEQRDHLTSSSGVFSHCNVVVVGGTFKLVERCGIGWHGWSLLARSIASSAFHNSSGQHGASRYLCAEHEAIQKAITDIINLNEDTPSTRLVWVNGPSAIFSIAQSIADSCLSPVTFFFRESADDIHPHYTAFIPTIAYQLCLLVPGARTLVVAAIERDPAIFSRSVCDQLRELILVPFTSLQQSHRLTLSHPAVIIVDYIHLYPAEQQRVITHALLEIIECLPRPVALILFSAPSQEIEHLLNTSQIQKPVTIITVPEILSASAKGSALWFSVSSIVSAIRQVASAFMRHIDIRMFA